VTHFLKRSGKPGLSHGAQRVRHPGVKTGRRHFSDTPREDWNIRQHANVLYTVDRSLNSSCNRIMSSGSAHGPPAPPVIPSFGHNFTI